MTGRFRRTVTVVLATTLFAIVLAGCQPPPGPRFIGMHGDHTWDVDNTRIASAFAAEEAFDSQLSRNTLRWNVVQPTRTTFDWSKTDYVVQKAVERSMHIMFVVRDAPQWANGDTDPKIIPSDTAGFDQFVTDYKNFVKAAVQRYGSRVQYWEIWTEPNQTFFWQPRGLNPTNDQARWIDMYAELYKKTRATVRTINTSVELAVGSLAGIGASCCILGAVFLNELINRGIVFDDVAIEPHSIRNQAPWVTIQDEGNFSDIKFIRDVLVFRGKSNVNVWVTEWGWRAGGFTSTGSTNVDLKIRGNFYALALWPNSGQVNVGGVVRNYSSINRSASWDSDGNGNLEPHNFITLTSPLPSVPAANTEVTSPQAEANQATYVRESIKMLRGLYVPQSGRPQQNYSYVELATYYQSYDLKVAFWAMYGLMHEPVPDYNNPGQWFLQGKPAALAFKDTT